MRFSALIVGTMMALSYLVLAQSCCGQGDGSAPAAPATQWGGPTAAGQANISVTPAGFVPATVVVSAGQPVRLVFTRTSDNTCATSVDLPDNRRVDLPLNRPITVTLAPTRAGLYQFACPMNMVRGTIVVQ